MGRWEPPHCYCCQQRCWETWGKAAFQMSATTAKLLSHNSLPYSAGLQETQLKNSEWKPLRHDAGCSHASSGNAYLKISASRDKHFAVGREAKVGHPASVCSSSFLYWNRSTQMKKLAIWDIPYLDKHDTWFISRVTLKVYQFQNIHTNYLRYICKSNSIVDQNATNSHWMRREKQARCTHLSF